MNFPTLLRTGRIIQIIVRAKLYKAKHQQSNIEQNKASKKNSMLERFFQYSKNTKYEAKINPNYFTYSLII